MGGVGRMLASSKALSAFSIPCRKEPSREELWNRSTLVLQDDMVDRHSIDVGLDVHPSTFLISIQSVTPVPRFA
jgi:hypothetical protein